MPDMLPFIDLNAQREALGTRIDEAVKSVIESGQFILGPQVRELEQRLAAFSGAPHALACANGTDALVLPLMGWGLRPGHAVFVPSFTFASTAEVVPWLGATPVFVDIDPETYCMDPQKLAAAIEKTKADAELTAFAVIAVDLFGHPADYPAIAAIAREHGLKLIADSAQGYGCTLDGHHPIHWADVATISFYPAKPLGCYGDGGAILVKDDDLLKRLRSLHVHGMGEDRYAYERIGMNSRLDTIQAAILLEKFDLFPAEIEARNAAARRYAEALGDLVRTPKVVEGAISVWAQYTIEVDDRDGFRKSMADRGVPTAVYYPRPLHSQPAYARYPAGPGGMAVTDAKASRVVSLPMDGYLGGERQQRVIEAVRGSV